MSSGIRSSTPTTCGSISQALDRTLRERKSVLGLPLIKNEKTVDPADPSSPKVIQIETAMGAAIEVFEGATAIGVGRDRFLPVKTTSDLLVLRSDAYDVQADGRLTQGCRLRRLSSILITRYYKIIGDFDQRFPAGAPSLKEARYLGVNGDWTFEAGVRVIGEVTLEDRGAPPDRSPRVAQLLSTEPAPAARVSKPQQAGHEQVRRSPPDDAERRRRGGVGHDRRRMGIHVDEYQRTFWTRPDPLVRHCRDRNDPRASRDDSRLPGLRVGGDHVDQIAGPEQG